MRKELNTKISNELDTGISPSEAEKFRRRAAIEPVIGDLKKEL